MNHKFYYYEYSDDGGNTWILGDYRRYLMDIMKLVREIPYRFRICNQDGIELNKKEIETGLAQLKLMECTFGEGGW